MHKIKECGFTLIELSIVLVIIGLIVGGVLVGQDLIKASEIRATISQYEKFNTVINTFRTKYNAVPGDMVASTASAFGFYSAPNFGNGNGVIEDPVVAAESNPRGEPVIFWRHLSQANLVDGTFGASIAAVTAEVPAGSQPPGQYVPPAKMGRGNYWLIGSATDRMNYYLLSSLTGLTGGGDNVATYVYNTTEGFTPVEAFNIDGKVDDGMPSVGIVQARGSQGSAGAGQLGFGLLADGVNNADWAASPVAGTCVTGPSPVDVAATYARAAPAGTTPSCNLRLRVN